MIIFFFSFDSKKMRLHHILFPLFPFASPFPIFQFLFHIPSHQNEMCCSMTNTYHCSNICCLWCLSSCFRDNFFFSLSFTTDHKKTMELHRETGVARVSWIPFFVVHIWKNIHTHIHTQTFSSTIRPDSLIYHQWWKYKAFVGLSSGQYKEDK